MRLYFDSTASSTLRGAGSVTINSAPPFGQFLTSTCPPCCTIIFCTTANPNPVTFRREKWPKQFWHSFWRYARPVIRDDDSLPSRLFAIDHFSAQRHAPSSLGLRGRRARDA